MTDYIRLLLASQPVYVERHEVDISVHYFLKDVIDRRARNVTVTTFLNAARSISERHTDPCKREHSNSEYPVRRGGSAKGTSGSQVIEVPDPRQAYVPQATYIPEPMTRKGVPVPEHMRASASQSTTSESA
jgi:hypothetical protein